MEAEMGQDPRKQYYWIRCYEDVEFGDPCPALIIGSPDDDNHDARTRWFVVGHDVPLDGRWVRVASAAISPPALADSDDSGGVG